MFCFLSRCDFPSRVPAKALSVWLWLAASERLLGASFPHQGQMAGRAPFLSSAAAAPFLSHHAGFHILAHALVVVVVVGPAGRRVEGRNAVEVEDEIFSVADRGRVMLVARQPHCKEKAKRAAFGKRPFFGWWWGDLCWGTPCKCSLLF